MTGSGCWRVWHSIPPPAVVDSHCIWVFSLAYDTEFPLLLVGAQQLFGLMDAELIVEARLADSGSVIRQSLQPGLVSSSLAGQSLTPLLVLGRLIGSQVHCIVDSTACDTLIAKCQTMSDVFICRINILNISRRASRSATVNIILK